MCKEWFIDYYDVIHPHLYEYEAQVLKPQPLCSVHPFTIAKVYNTLRTARLVTCLYVETSTKHIDRTRVLEIKMHMLLGMKLLSKVMKAKSLQWKHIRSLAIHLVM
jgi:hypothetical protein